MRPLVGIFVGGAGRRMGGAAKGLLPAPDRSGTLVERLARIAADEGLAVVLVGVRPDYAALGLEVVPDAATDEGPLAGLVALLERAGDAGAIAVACDMPYVERALLAKLAAVTTTTAPRRGGRWEPLVARYAPTVLPLARARLARGERSLQGLLDDAGAVELVLDETERAMLVDWDTPDDRA